MTSGGGPNGRSVALYSGGLDSWIIAHFYKPDVLLYVDLGSRYTAAERRDLAAPPGLEDRIATAPLHLGWWERGDAVIPGRNAHLVLTAAHYGDTIFIGSTGEDPGADNTSLFRGRMNALLACLYGAGQAWLPEGRLVTVRAPFEAMTKAAMVSVYLRDGGDPAPLVETSLSCYDPRRRSHGARRHCGRCNACHRKAHALNANGIDPGYRVYK